MVTSAPIDSDGTCTVEGRYATIDDIGPTISVSNAGVFNTNPDTWCSITKWQQAK